jgi:hypothetical protein
MLSIDSIKPTSEKDKGETTELLEKIFEGNESSMSEESGTEDEFTKK